MGETHVVDLEVAQLGLDLDVGELGAQVVDAWHFAEVIKLLSASVVGLERDW